MPGQVGECRRERAFIPFPLPPHFQHGAGWTPNPAVPERAASRMRRGEVSGEPLWGGTWAKYTQAVLLMRHDLAAARAAWLAAAANEGERKKRKWSDFLCTATLPTEWPTSTA